MAYALDRSRREMAKRFGPFHDRIQSRFVKRIAGGRIANAEALGKFVARGMPVGAEHAIPQRKERSEIAVAMLGCVVEAVELRTRDPTTRRSQLDLQVHVDPISPQRKHRPEPGHGDWLEIEQDRHRKIDDERPKHLLTEMIAVHRRYVEPLLLMVKFMLRPQPAHGVLRPMPPIEEEIEDQEESKRLQDRARKTVRKMDGHPASEQLPPRTERPGSRRAAHGRPTDEQN